MNTPDLKRPLHVPAFPRMFALPAMLMAGLAVLVCAREEQPGGPSTGEPSGQPAHHQRGEVPVVISARATSPERIAAAELAGYLGRIYQETRFVVVTAPAGDGGRIIRLGTPASMPGLL